MQEHLAFFGISTSIFIPTPPHSHPLRNITYRTYQRKYIMLKIQHPINTDHLEHYLLALGKALNHDLLPYCYPVTPEPQVPLSKHDALQKELDTLKVELKNKDEEPLNLRTENNVLREVFGKK